MKNKIYPEYIRQRLFEKNQNLSILTVGSTGSGKSYSNLRLAEDYYKHIGKGRFPIENVVFSAKDFMSLINSGNLKRGNAIVFEEIGIAQSSRNWYSLINKLLNFVFQSYRRMGLLVLLNTPDTSFVDSHTRRLIHFIFETVSIDFSKKVCRIKPMQIQVNKRSGKIYQKYLRVKIKDQVVRLERLKFGLPSKKLRELYEAKKKCFTEELNQSILNDILEAEKSKKQKLGRCFKCSHRWVIRAKELPLKCPSCQTRKWNTKPVRGFDDENG